MLAARANEATVRSGTEVMGTTTDAEIGGAKRGVYRLFATQRSKKRGQFD
jgi:hypothetical protein